MGTHKTPLMVLQELTVKQGLAPPVFQIVFSKSGTHENRFDYAVNVAGIQAHGSGPSKQVGKHEAAHNALKKLQEKGIYNPTENPVAEFKVPLNDSESPFKTALNCIMELQNMCGEYKIPPPEFIEISGIGPAHAKEFTFECRISSITTEAKASTKKTARQLAAKEMLSRITDVIDELQVASDKTNRCLLDQETEAMVRYQELTEVIPDKTVKIDELSHTFKNLMNLKELKYEEFQEDLKRVSEASLKTILDKLEIKYEIRQFQESPCMVSLIIKIDTPFIIIKKGFSFEEARGKTLRKAFKIMECYMQLEF